MAWTADYENSRDDLNYYDEIPEPHEKQDHDGNILEKNKVRNTDKTFRSTIKSNAGSKADVCATQLFFLEKNTSAYDRERNILVGDLYNYVITGSKGKESEKFGVEIMQTADNCIKNFDLSYGDPERPVGERFLIYFSSSLKKTIGTAKAKEKYDSDYQGMTKLPLKIITKYRKYKATYGEPMTNEDYRHCADALEVSLEKLTEAIEAERNTCISGDTPSSGENGENSLSVFDRIADSDAAVENGILEEESNREILTAIEDTYSGLQERQKPLAADLFTVLICTASPELLDMFEKQTCCSKDIVNSFRESGVPPTQREIAAKFERNEASISRTYKELMDKLQQKLEQYRRT